jgi:hypothetical protein
MSVLQEGDELKGAFDASFTAPDLSRLHIELTLTVVYIGKTMPHVHVLDGWERRAGNECFTIKTRILVGFQDPLVASIWIPGPINDGLGY